MLKGFEEITAELTPDELELVQPCVIAFQKYTQSSPIKAADVVRKFNDSRERLGIKKTMSEPLLRKICNYIRSNSLLPLIATSKGYFVSDDVDQIRDQIESLEARANSINRCAEGLKKYLV